MAREIERPVALEAFGVRPGVWRFEDGTASLYMIAGTERAVVIDTGMARGRLVPALRQYTALPLTLLITHGHGDHMAHADEFDAAYISIKDIPFIETACERLGIEKPMDASRFHSLEGGQVLRLGDIDIHVLALPGHSAGSVAFYAPRHNLIFTGDAVGSGVGVWMQIPGSTSIGEYRFSLAAFLEETGRMTPEPEFLPGHYGQRFMGGADNPVCLPLIRDMAALCEKLLDGTAETAPAPELKRTEEETFLATFQRAAIVYVPSSLKDP